MTSIVDVCVFALFAIILVGIIMIVLKLVSFGLKMLERKIKRKDLGKFMQELVKTEQFKLLAVWAAKELSGNISENDTK